MRRRAWRRRLPLLGLTAALAVLMAVALSLGEKDDPPVGPGTAPVEIPSQASTLELPPEGRHFGFNDGGFVHTGRGGPYDVGVSVRDEVAWTRGAGADVHRFTLDWRAAEPQPGAYDQAYVGRLQEFARAFEAAGGRVVVVLAIAPDWAASGESCGACIRPPADDPQGMQAWDRFVRFAARAFPRALGFEVWNEPNSSLAWNPRPQPDRYARIANAALKVLRAEAPDAKVAVGSLASFGVEDDERMTVTRFLREAARAGLSRDFDAVSWHAYPLQDGKRVRIDAREVTDVIDALQRAIRAYDGDVPQWITEVGVSTTGREWGVAPGTQATGLLRVLSTMYGLRAVEMVLVHNLIEDRSLPDRAPEKGYGVVQAVAPGDQRAKPAWCALRTVAGAPGAEPASAACP